MPTIKAVPQAKTVAEVIKALQTVAELYPEGDQLPVAVTSLSPIWEGAVNDSVYKAVWAIFGPPVYLVNHEQPFVLLGSGDQL